MVDFPRFLLADFEDPPVVETVLSLQFERLTAVQTVHLGLFWHRVKHRFPKTEERPALPQAIERFPGLDTRGARILFEAVEIPIPPRVLLLNKEGSEMIQLQNDRFVKNWRKADDLDQYPHYEPVIKPGFERDFAEFQSFLSEEGLGEVKVNQCEVTYVNHIVSGKGWDRYEDISRVFAFWCHTHIPPGDPEDATVHLRFPIPDEQNRPIGRLHVDVQPATRASDNRPMYVMNLTARGQYGSGWDFFDIGRKWIVKSFEQLTTQEMHRIWRKK